MARASVRFLVLAAALVLFLGGSLMAQAATRSATYEVGGATDCSGDRAYEVSLPARAIRIKANPGEGHSWYQAGAEVAYVDRVSARNGARAVRWTVTPVRCEFGPWSVGLQTFTANFKRLSRKPVIKQRQAKTAAIRAITGRLNVNWTKTDRINCSKKLSRNTRRCRVKLFFASVIMHGRARVSLFSQPNTELYAKVRYRVVAPAPFGKTYRGNRRVSLGRY
jgi:hypothetical protein